MLRNTTSIAAVAVAVAAAAPSTAVIASQRCALAQNTAYMLVTRYQSHSANFCEYESFATGLSLPGFDQQITDEAAAGQIARLDDIDEQVITRWVGIARQILPYQRGLDRMHHHGRIRIVDR